MKTGGLFLFNPVVNFGEAQSAQKDIAKIYYGV